MRDIYTYFKTGIIKGMGLSIVLPFCLALFSPNLLDGQCTKNAPFSENWDGGNSFSDFNSCWSQVYGSNSRDDVEIGDDDGVRSSPNAAILNDGASLVTPEIANIKKDCWTLTFWASLENRGNDDLEVAVTDAPPSPSGSFSTYKVLKTIEYVGSSPGEDEITDDETYRKYTVNLPSYNAKIGNNKYLVIQSQEGNYEYYIDDVAIEGPSGGAVDKIADEDFQSGFPSSWTATGNYRLVTGCAQMLTGSNQAFAAGGNAVLTTKSFDLSNNDWVSFAYDVGDDDDFGNTCIDEADGGDFIYTEYWDGSQWVRINSVEGSNGTYEDVFVRDSFYLSSGLSGNFKLRLVSNGSGANLDSWIIDNIKVYTDGTDIGIASIEAPAPGQKRYGHEKVKLMLKNFLGGSKVIPAGTSIPIKLKSTLGGTKTINYFLKSDLKCSRVITLDEKVNLACKGLNEITAWTEFDRNPGNDTARESYSTGGLSEGFENGKLGKAWTVNQDFTIQTRAAHTGSYSAGIWKGNANIDADYAPSGLRGGKKVDTLEFYWYESSNNNGFVVQMVDNNGQSVLEIGGDNPQWEVNKDGQTTNCFEIFDGNRDYNDWIRYTLTFDWQNGTYSYDMENLDEGWTRNGSRPLIRSTNIEELRFRGTQASNCLGDADHILFDDIRVVTGQKAKRTQPPKTVGFVGDDTAYVNSPATYSSKQLNSDNYHQWYVKDSDGDDSLVLEGEGVLDYEFTDTGSQQVRLITSGCFGVDTATKTVEVIQPTRKPKADFLATRNVIDSNEALTLIDESDYGPTRYDWSVLPRKTIIGGGGGPPIPITNYQALDGTDSFSSRYRLQFIFTGTYDVCLEASNSQGTDTVCKEDYIIVRSQRFMCNTTSSDEFYGVLYDDGGSDNNYSDNQNCSYLINPCADSIRLNFSEFDLGSGDYLRIYDGKSSNGQPMWDISAYGQQGLSGNLSASAFKKRLVAQSGSVYLEFESDGSGSGSGFELGWRSEQGQFNAPTAKFNLPDTSCVGSPFRAVSNSQGKGLSYRWNFDDDDIQEGDSSVVYAFDSMGSQDVSLIVNNCGGYDTLTKSIYIRSPKQAPTPGYYADERTPLAGNTVVKFFDTSQNCVNYYKWEFSTDAVSYVNGTDSNSFSPEVIFNQTGCIDVTLNVGNNFDTVQLKKKCYIDAKCVPSVVNMLSDIGISHVSVGDIMNSSDIGTRGYSNYFPQQSTHIEQGEVNTLKIGRNTTFNPMNVKVWIDLDDNNSFSEPGELMVDSTGSFQQLKTEFTIPDTAATGSLRMRIGTNAAGLSNDPCGPNRFGEFEDYRLRVTEDITAPVIKLQGNDTISLAACGSIGQIDTGTYAVDNVDGRIMNVTRKGFIDSSRAGIDTFTYEVVDSAGNVGRTYRYVKVERDQVAPQFSLKGKDTVSTHVYSSYTDSGYTTPSDNCSGLAGVSYDDSGLDTAQVGLMEVHYRATDNAGNTNTLTRYVNVIDTVDPTGQLPSAGPIRIRLDSAFMDPGLDTMYDNYWSGSSLNVTVKGQVDTRVTDTFMLDYEITDGSGNKTVLSRKVIVEDKLAPSYSGNISSGDTVEVDVGTRLDAQAQLTIMDNSGNAVKREKGGAYYNRVEDNDDKAGYLGLYDAELRFSDGNGNTDTLRFYVNVVDRVSPRISLKGPRIKTITRFDTTKYEAIDSGAMIEENHGLAVKRTDDSASYFSDYLPTYPEGFYEIRYIAEDSAGNRATVTRYVNIGTNVGREGLSEGGLSLSLYPNPTQGALHISLNVGESQEGRLAILNGHGKTIEVLQEGRLSGGDYEVDMSERSSGVYFVKFSGSEGVKVKRFVVNK